MDDVANLASRYGFWDHGRELTATPTTFERVLAEAEPGDTIRCGPGTYELPEGGLPPGVRIIGAGAERTTLR